MPECAFENHWQTPVIGGIGVAATHMMHDIAEGENQSLICDG